MTIIINVSYEPLQLVDFCITHVRKHYPQAHIVMVGDGIVGDYPMVAKKHGCEWVSGESLCRIYRYPLYTDRIFQLALQRKDDWYLLLDPDTKIWRPFKEHPDADVVGQIIPSFGGKIPTVHGCATLFRRNIVEKYQTISRDVWHDLPVEYQNHLFSQQAYKHDHNTPFIFKRLGAVVVDNHDVRGVFYEEPLPKNDDLEFAATHPHKQPNSW